jgi:hypothetical protein
MDKLEGLPEFAKGLGCEKYLLSNDESGWGEIRCVLRMRA